MKKILLFALLLAVAFMLSAVCFAEETVAEIENSETSAIPETELTEEEKEAWEIQIWFENMIDRLIALTPEDWHAVINEKVVPWVTLAVSAVLGIYVAIAPILAKIKKTSGIFDGAAGTLGAATETVDKAQKKIKETQEELKEKYDELQTEFKGVKEGYDSMLQSLSNIESIVRLGFGNTDELIIKGYANEIEKVGKSNVENQEQK